MFLKKNKTIAISLLALLQSISLSSPGGQKKSINTFDQGNEGDFTSNVTLNKSNSSVHSSSIGQDKVSKHFYDEDVQPLHEFGRYILDILPSFHHHDLKIMAEKTTPYCLFDDHGDFSAQPFDDFETKGYCIEKEIEKKLKTIAITGIGHIFKEYRSEIMKKLKEKLIALHADLLNQEDLIDILENDENGLEASIGSKLVTIFLHDVPLLGNSSELLLTSVDFGSFRNEKIIVCTKDSWRFPYASPIFLKDLFDFPPIFLDRNDNGGDNCFHNIFFRKKFQYSEELEICTKENEQCETDFWKDDFFVIKDDFLKRMHSQGILFKPFVMNHIFFKLVGSLWGNKDLEECFAYVQKTKDINGPEAERLRNIFQKVLSPKERKFLIHNLFTLNKKYTLNIKKDFYQKNAQELEDCSFDEEGFKITEKDSVYSRILKNKYQRLHYKQVNLNKEEIKNYVGYETLSRFNIKEFILETIKGFFNCPSSEDNLHVSYLENNHSLKFFFNLPHEDPQLIKLANFEMLDNDFFPLYVNDLYSDILTFFFINDVHGKCTQDYCYVQGYPSCLRPGKDNDQSFLFPVTMTSNHGFHQLYNHSTVKKIMSSYKKTKKHLYIHQEDKTIKEENKIKIIKFEEFLKLFYNKFFPQIESLKKDISFYIYIHFFIICLSSELQLTQETYSLIKNDWHAVNSPDLDINEERFIKQYSILRTIKKLYTSCILKNYEEEYSILEAEVESLKQFLNFHRSLFMYNKKKNLDLKATKVVENEQDDPMNGTSKAKTEVKNFLPDYCRRDIYLTIWNFLLKDKIRDLIYYYSKIYDPVYKNEYKDIVRKNLLWNLMSSYDIYQNYNDQEFYNNIRFICKKFVVPLMMEILDFENEKYYNENPSEEEKKEKKRFYDNLLPTLEDSSSDSEEDFYLDNSLRRKALEEKFSDLVKNKKKDYFYKKEVDFYSQNQKNLKAEENQNLMNFFHKNYKEEAKEEKNEFSTEEARVLENLNVDDYLLKKKSLFERGISKGNLKKK